jgi:hypothetical protein
LTRSELFPFILRERIIILASGYNCFEVPVSCLSTSEEDNTEGSEANEGTVFRGTYFERQCATRRHKHNSLLDHSPYLVTAEKLFCDTVYVC